MFLIKNKYYLIIESIKDIDLSNLKRTQKFIIIYRSKHVKEKLNQILNFRKLCKAKGVEFYISNDVKLVTTLKADGLYLSAHNKNLGSIHLKKSNYKIIGSAHNIKEINLKILQGCNNIFFSRLFKTSYANKKDFLGIIRFNLINLKRKERLIPLGGIRLENLNKLNLVNCESFAVLSEIKKKPAKLINRLF